MIPSRISTRRGFASGLLGVAAISLLPMGALAAPPTSEGGVTLEPLGTFDGGGLAHAEIVARDFPDYVNTQADDGAATARAMVESMADEADARSDDKGTEPEAVAVGRIGDRQYAFIGLERQGGIMVYDVTDPTAPAFEDYVNVALSELAVGGDFSGPGTTDVSPEGVVFVPASSSPNGEPLVIVANELSGTTTVYAVRGTEIDTALATVATLPATGASLDALLVALLLTATGGALLATRRRA